MDARSSTRSPRCPASGSCSATRARPSRPRRPSAAASPSGSSRAGPRPPISPASARPASPKARPGSTKTTTEENASPSRGSTLRESSARRRVGPGASPADPYLLRSYRRRTPDSRGPLRDAPAGRESAWSAGDAPGPTRRIAGTSLALRRRLPLGAVGHAPEVPRGRRPMRPPPLPVGMHGLGSRVPAQSVGDAKALPDAEIVDGQNVLPAEGADEQHLDRPP